MGYGNGGATVGTFTGGAVGVQAPRQSAIGEQMLVLDQRTETLNNLVQELEARISGVLSMAPPSVNEKTPAVATTVALGASLNQMNDRLGLIAQYLRNVIERVEL